MNQININKVQIAKPVREMDIYFLKVYGVVDAVINKRYINRTIGITESDDGPLFINKGKKGFFIYRNSALNKLMKTLAIFDVAEFKNKKLPVTSNKKGFWIINSKQIKS